MMKAGHLMTMTRNNGEARSRSFNAHTNRASSSPSPSDTSANYDYGPRSDISFDLGVSGRASSEDTPTRISDNILLSKNRRQQSATTEQPSATAPSSPRLLSDNLLSAPAFVIGRSASLRSRATSQDRTGQTASLDQSDSTENRLPRRSGSTRDRSGERRRAEYVSATENYRYRERRCVASNVNYQLHPPPTIVTTLDDPDTIDRSATVSPTSEDDDLFVQTQWSNQSHLLAVPGYESPPQSLSPSSDIEAAARSRSRSAPTNPNLRPGDHKSVQLTRSDACSGRSESDTSSSAGEEMQSQRLFHRKSNPESNYDYYSDRPPVDRRVSYNPTTTDDEDGIDQRTMVPFRDRNRKYSCVDVGRSGEKTFLAPGTGSRVRGEQQQPELRRMASSGTEPPRRRFLPPTPDELIRRQQQQQGRSDQDFLPSATASNSAFLDVNYSGTGTKKPFLLPSSSLPGSAGVVQERDPASSSLHRQLSSGPSGLLGKDNEGRANQPISPHNKRDNTAIISQPPLPSTSARPGSGRKLPAEPPTPIQSHSSPSKTALFRQNAVADTRPISPQSPQSPQSDNYYRRDQTIPNMERVPKSSSSEDEDAWPSPAQTTTTTPTPSETSSRTPVLTPSNRRVSGNQNLFKKYHQSSVSSSSSVPDFQGAPSPNAPVCPGQGLPHDMASDSGHGSGAESGIGDGATVSASNSWPDAIVSGVIMCNSKTPVAATSLTSVSPSTDGSSRRGSAVSPPPSPSIGSLGLVHFSLQYFPVRKRMRVSVIKAELKMEVQLNAFVKICLMPGKQQKQKGERMVKRSKEATFNEEFFFDNITAEDVESKSVYVRLCHHVGKQFQKDVVIGQMEVSLRDFQPILLGKQEVKMCQELKAKQLKKLGRIQISTCLEKDARRLTINIFKADDLPKFGITGPPDPFVRITVDQNGWVQTKQSRTLKSTCSAVFKEAIMFLVSTKVTDLEKTKVVITVHDAARTSSGDDVIGHVYLGQLASDKAEIDQWKNSITHFGREFKATHQLKRESNAASAGEDKDRLSADDDF